MLEDGSGVGPEGYANKDGDAAANEKRKSADHACPKVWFVAPAGSIPPPPNKVRGPFRISDLKQFMSTGDLHPRSLVSAAHVEDYGETGESAPATDASIDTGKWKHIEDVWQLRWQLCTTGEGVFTPSEVGLVAMRALTRLVDMHRSVDYRGVPYHPIPFGKRVVSEPASLHVLAQLLLADSPALVDEAASLLDKVLDHNPNAQVQTLAHPAF